MVQIFSLLTTCINNLFLNQVLINHRFVQIYFLKHILAMVSSILQLIDISTTTLNYLSLDFKFLCLLDILFMVSFNNLMMLMVLLTKPIVNSMTISIIILEFMVTLSILDRIAISINSGFSRTYTKYTV